MAGSGRAEGRSETQGETRVRSRDPATPTAPGERKPPRQPSKSGATFHEGDVVAGRYRVVRGLANGGMGEVYEVEDLELRERVALKTVLPELATDSRIIDRFKREAQLARRITHPNVCRLFDVGSHVEGELEVTFLTMELLSGETLTERIRRARLTTAEAMPIVRQLAGGLAATHASGIVHRDFKAENVVLCDGGSTGQRAVITDFGIARGSGISDRFASSVTMNGEFIGSPHYMSPEQVEGEDDITSAADIYSLGIVIYEMVTGTLPFNGATDYATAAKRLTQDPPPPSTHVPDLDPLWEAVILRCLARDPGARYASALAVAAALDAGIHPATTNPGSRRAQTRSETRDNRTHALAPRGGKRISGRTIGIAAAILALGASAGAYALSRDRGSSAGDDRAAPPATGPRRSVAVIAPHDRNRDDERWVGVALAEWLDTELRAGEQLRVAAGSTTSRVADSLDLQTREPDPAARAQLHQSLAVDELVYGTYLVDGDHVSIELQLVNAESGDAAGEPIHDDASTSELPALADRVGAKLRERFGAPPLSASDRRAVDAVLIAPRATAQAYANGLTALRHDDGKAARELLATAVAAAPDKALIHAALSRALDSIGDEKAAKEQADRAFALAGTMAREDRLAIEALRAESTGDWGRAAELYGALWTFFPDDLEYGLDLVHAQANAGKNKDGEATVAMLQRLPPPARDDPRLDIADAEIAENLGNLKHERDAARRAITKLGADQGADYSHARSQEGWALFQLGDLVGAVASYRECERIARAAGDRIGIANALVNLATVMRHQGKTAEAEQGFIDSLALYEQVGAKTRMWNALNGRAILDAERGDLAGAQAMFESAQKVCKEIGDRVGETTSEMNVGVILQQRGMFAEAKLRVQDAVDMARELDDRRMTASALDSLSRIVEDAGDLSEARRQQERALTTREEIGDRLGAAQSRAALAELLLQEGKTPDAAIALKASAEELQQLEDFDQATAAYSALAIAQLANHHVPEARAAVDAGLADTVKGDDKATRLTAQITEARVRASDGHPDPKRLAALGAEATALGLVGVALDAKLAIAETAGGHARAAVAKEARAAGFELLARRAER